MRNKEQKRDLSVQAIAGPSAVGMISTKLFPGWNTRLHAQRGYFTIHGRQERAPRRTDAGLRAAAGHPARAHPSRPGLPRNRWHQRLLDFPDLERLKNDIHRCNRIGVEDTHTKPQPGTLRQGAH